MKINETYFQKIELLKYNIINFKDFSSENKTGIYAFWWIKDKELLLKSNLDITLLGKIENKKQTQIKYKWQLENYELPIALYIGKTTNLQGRIKGHLAKNVNWENWYLTQKTITRNNEKHTITGEEHSKKNFIYKINTVCQFRAGLQHILKSNQNINRLEDTYKFLGISFIEIPSQTDEPIDYSVGDRFYMEDLAIGYYRPLFNVDSER